MDPLIKSQLLNRLNIARAWAFFPSRLLRNRSGSPSGKLPRGSERSDHAAGAAAHPREVLQANVAREARGGSPVCVNGAQLSCLLRGRTSDPRRMGLSGNPPRTSPSFGRSEPCWGSDPESILAGPPCRRGRGGRDLGRLPPLSGASSSPPRGSCVVKHEGGHW